MEKLFFELGIYLPVLIFISALVMAFANVLTEKLQKKISKKVLYIVMLPICVVSLLGFTIYLHQFMEVKFFISGPVILVVLAIIITLAEEAFRRIMKN